MDQLDVRIPIGGMFTTFGVVLIVYGLVSDPAIYQRSLGINVNLWWGLVLVVFGVVRSGRASVAQATAWPRRDQSSQTAAGRDRALPSDHLPGVW